MSDETSARSFLFNAPPLDSDAQRVILARELRVAKGFTLIFALCDSVDERTRQRTLLEKQLPDLSIQDVAVRREIPHLLHVLRATLEEPLPDAVFVYGIENWIPRDVEPRSLPFFLNLNASRNHFYKDCPCPLVFWIPEYLLRHIATGAPDFFSVRSGVYTFASPLSEAKEAAQQSFQSLDSTEMAGLSLSDKHQRIAELEDLRTRLQNLSTEQRNERDEAAVSTELAKMYYVMGRYDEAEPLHNEALDQKRRVLPQEHPAISISLNNLANVYQVLGRYDEAEPLYLEALAIDRKISPEGHPDIARDLNNLARLYRALGRYDEAESLYNEALDIRRKALPEGHHNIARDLNNLAILYVTLGRYDEAEPLYLEALDIRRKALPEGHPDIAINLNNLATLYQKLGRYDEAEPLYLEALQLIQRSFGQYHPQTQLFRKNLEMFLQIRRIDEQ